MAPTPLHYGLNAVDAVAPAIRVAFPDFATRRFLAWAFLRFLVHAPHAAGSFAGAGTTAVLGVAGTLLALGSLYQHMVGGTLTLRSAGRSPVELGVAASAVVFVPAVLPAGASAPASWSQSARHSTLAFWSVLMGFDQLGSLARSFGQLRGQLLGPFPQCCSASPW